MTPNIDEYDWVIDARCPECRRQLMLVDEDDEIYFCATEKGCKWSGKFQQLDYVKPIGGSQ